MVELRLLLHPLELLLLQLSLLQKVGQPLDPLEFLLLQPRRKHLLLEVQLLQRQVQTLPINLLVQRV
jgi:hypothetical protein